MIKHLNTSSMFSRFVYLGGLLFVLFQILPVVVLAQPSPTINYQGKLTDDTGAAVADGNYDMEFNLYTVSTGGSSVWTESLTGGNQVTVTNGLFSVMLGSVSTLTGVDFNQELYLGVNIDSDGEMSPRKMLGTVPAAFQAYELGGVASSSFVRSDTADIISATEASTLLTIDQAGSGDILNLLDDGTEVFTVLDGGNVGIGTTTPDARLAIAGDVNIIDNTSILGGLSLNGVPLVTGSTTLNNFYFAGATSSSIASGIFNFMFGEGAGNNITSGNNNLAFGNNALSLATAGSNNTALGLDALSSTNGSHNIAIGRQALGDHLSGSGNIALGFGAAERSAAATGNVVIGQKAMEDSVFGGENVAVGYRAGRFAEGDYNVYLGSEAGENNLATGTIAIGYRAADNATAADNSIFIGYNIDAQDSTLDNQLNIGNIIFGTDVDGQGTTLSTGNIGIGTSSPTARLTVDGSVRFGDLTDGLLLADDEGNLSSIATSSLGIIDNDTQLTEEEVEDFAFNDAFTSNTETLITATYQVADNTVDLVVNDDLSLFDNTTSAFLSTVDISDDSNLTVGDGITLTDDQLTVTAAGGLLQTAGGITTTGVLEDLNGIGVPSADNQFIVSTGAGSFGYEGAGSARASLGLGTVALLSSINNANWSGTDLSIANGGTGASTDSAARTNLGLEIGVDVQAFNASTSLFGVAVDTDELSFDPIEETELDSEAELESQLAGVTNVFTDNDTIGIANGGTGASTDSAARTNLGLAIGTDVQAYDADLDTYAGITPLADTQSLLGAANYAAMRSLLDLEAGTDFYSIAAADAAFAAAGTESLFTDGGDTTYLTALSDNLAIGTTTATSELTVFGSDDGSPIAQFFGDNQDMQLYSTNNTNPDRGGDFEFYRTRGGSDVVDGDKLGGLRFLGDLAGYQPGALIAVSVDGSAGDGGNDLPTEMTFNVSADGQNLNDGNPELVIRSSGNVGIGDVTPDSLLTVGSGDAFQVNDSGDVDISGVLAVGANGDINSGYLVDIDQTLTATTGVRAFNLELNRNTTLTNTIVDYANYTQIVLSNLDENGSNYDGYAVVGEVLLTDGSSVSDIGGLYGYARNNADTTGDIADSLRGVYAEVHNDQPNGTTTNMFGVYSLADNDGWATNQYGGYFETLNDSTTDSSVNMYGVHGLIDNNQSGSNAHALSSFIENNSTLSNGYGLFSDLTNTSGTIDDYYGVFIRDVVEGVQTNAYAFWTNEGDMVLDGNGDGVAGGNDAGSDLFFGEGQDAAVWYDGANLVIDPDVEGSGRLSVAGDIGLTGALLDGSTSAGTNGQILQTTGSGVQWVATSSLGISGGSPSLFTDAGASTYLTSLTDNFGIGTTSPYATLSVAGDIALTGGLYDSTATQGTNGQILQTTGSGVQWVATSTLGIGSSSLFIDGGAVTYLASTTDVLAVGTTSAPTYASNVSLVAAGGGIVSDVDSIESVSQMELGASSDVDTMAISGSILYASANTAIYSIDISDDQNPVLLDTYTAVANVNDLDATGGYLYATLETGSAPNVLIIDTKNPSNLSLTSSTTAADDATAVAVSGDKLLVGSSFSGDDFEVFDITDPVNPVLMGGVGLTQEVNAFDIHGTYAYVVTATIGDDFEIVDFSDPYNPVKIGGMNLHTNPNAVAVQGNRAYVGLNFNSGTAEDLIVIDISDPTTPTQIGAASSTVGSSPGQLIDLAVTGSHVYAASQRGFIEVFDVSSSTDPISVASGSTEQSPRSMVMKGNKVYTGQSAGTVDIEIFDIGGVTAPGAAIGSLFTQQLDVDSIFARDGLFEGSLNIGKSALVSDSLSIGGSARLLGALYDTNNASGTDGMVLQTTGSGVQWVATSSLGISGSGSSLFTDAGASTYLTSLTDNLGIGTTTPTARLDLYDATEMGEYVFKIQNATADGDFAEFTNASGTAVFKFNTFSAGNQSAELGMLDDSGVERLTYEARLGRILLKDALGDSTISLQGGSGTVELTGSGTVDIDGTNAQIRLTDSNSFSDANDQFVIDAENDNLLFTFDDDSAGTDTEVLALLSSGNVGIGTTSPSTKLTIQSDTMDGAGISGLSQYLTTTNSVASAVQFGNYFELSASNTATTTTVGAIYRLADNTTFGNTVRGLEVQTNRGTNTEGENTALSGFARTFGVRGVTTGDAGGSFEPAGGFFETEGTTQGNAIRGFSGSITSASLLSLFQDTSDFTGTGLEMNFGNTTGDFSSTSSKYLDFQNAGNSVFTVSAFGTTTIGDGTTNNMAGLQIGFGGICVDNDGSCSATTTGNITAVSYGTANSDLAEMYFSSTDLEPGELVTLAGGLSIDRAEPNADLPILGVVSTKPGLTLGFDDTSLNANEDPFPIALRGRVPVLLSTENGPIKKGDRLMLSSLPGIAMKATGTGMTVGIALEDFNDRRMYSETFINQFGDDMVDPVYDPVFSNADPRIDDGCYYGGGAAAGEVDCVPLQSTSTSGQIAEVNERLETESVAEQLEELASERSDTRVLANGSAVRVGQVVMFVENQYKWIDDSQFALMDALMSTSTLAEQADEDEPETFMDRLLVLADSFVAGVLSVFELRADRVEVAEELCVDGVCLNAENIRTLLNDVNTDVAPVITNESENNQEEVTPGNDNSNNQNDDQDSDTSASSTDEQADTASTTDSGSDITTEEPVATSTDPAISDTSASSTDSTTAPVEITTEEPDGAIEVEEFAESIEGLEETDVEEMVTESNEQLIEDTEIESEEVSEVTA